MRPRNVSVFCLLALTCSAAQAAPKPHTAPPLAEPWLATARRTRTDVLAQLAPRASQPPYNKILPLLTRAQAELQRPLLSEKRSGIGDAYDAALLILTQTQDRVLAARLFDGFLLASLRFASPGPALYDGRRHLLKAAFGAYQQAGQEDRQLAVLRLLRREAQGDENLSDWVSLQFAAVYAHRGQYQPAMDALNAVQSPGMSGGTASLPDLQMKLDDQELKRENKRQAGRAPRHPAGRKHFVKH